jgi:hypothetical protein
MAGMPWGPVKRLSSAGRPSAERSKGANRNDDRIRAHVLSDLILSFSIEWDKKEK